MKILDFYTVDDKEYWLSMIQKNDINGEESRVYRTEIF